MGQLPEAVQVQAGGGALRLQQAVRQRGVPPRSFFSEIGWLLVHLGARVQAARAAGGALVPQQGL